MIIDNIVDRIASSDTVGQLLHNKEKNDAEFQRVKKIHAKYIERLMKGLSRDELDEFENADSQLEGLLQKNAYLLGLKEGLELAKELSNFELGNVVFKLQWEEETERRAEQLRQLRVIETNLEKGRS